MPAYAKSVANFELLTSRELQETWVPRRSEAHEIHGWKFEAFFCEAPEYVRYLYSLYAEIGGRVLDPPGNGGLPAYLELNHDVYVNCTGIGAHAFLRSAAEDPKFTDWPLPPAFEPLVDPIPSKLIRGHYLRININEIPTGH